MYTVKEVSIHIHTHSCLVYDALLQKDLNSERICPHDMEVDQHTDQSAILPIYQRAM